jgi:hypothetical protein
VITLRQWFDPVTRIQWHCVDGEDDVRVGITEHYLASCADPKRAILEALCALRDELGSGARILGDGDAPRRLAAGDRS